VTLETKYHSWSVGTMSLPKEQRPIVAVMNVRDANPFCGWGPNAEAALLLLERFRTANFQRLESGPWSSPRWHHPETPCFCCADRASRHVLPWTWPKSSTDLFWTAVDRRTRLTRTAHVRGNANRCSFNIQHRTISTFPLLYPIGPLLPLINIRRNL
jgi:hypothetical protein